MAAVFASMLPVFVAAAEGAVGEMTGALWPVEEARIGKAVESRRAEYRAGRILARRALALVGGPDTAIPTGEAGAPIWPLGFTGSISHAADRVAAVAARRADARSIGIDIEAIARFAPKLAPKLLTATEIQATSADQAGPAFQRALAALFCAKEAFYKMQFPVTGRRLGFLDAEVALGPDNGAFQLTLLAPAAPFCVGDRFDGRWATGDGIVSAAIWLGPSGRPSCEAR